MGIRSSLPKKKLLHERNLVGSEAQQHVASHPALNSRTTPCQNIRVVIVENLMQDKVAHLSMAQHRLGGGGCSTAGLDALGAQ